MNEGDTFQLVNTADHHLWIIISDPANHPNEVLFVNLTSHDPKEDQTVVLDAGEHTFIAHRTCVCYSRARVATNADLERLRSARRIILHPPASAGLLQKIRDGAVLSPRIKIDHLRLLQDQGLIDQ